MKIPVKVIPWEKYQGNNPLIKSIDYPKEIKGIGFKIFEFKDSALYFRNKFDVKIKL